MNLRDEWCTFARGGMDSVFGILMEVNNLMVIKRQQDAALNS